MRSCIEKELQQLRLIDRFYEMYVFFQFYIINLLNIENTSVKKSLCVNNFNTIDISFKISSSRLIEKFAYYICVRYLIAMEVTKSH